jgi:D-xylose transport system substrate-binding protein
VLAAIAALALVASGCGGGESTPTIALLLPSGRGLRYASADRPAFERRVREVCPDCRVLYSDANERTSTQEDQADAALKRGADVLVLDAVVSESAAGIVKRARAAGVPVLSYDTLAAFAKPNAFVSYGGAQTGEVQARALAARLKREGHPRGPVVALWGEPGNRDQHLFEVGARRVLAARRVKIASQAHTPFWGPGRARTEMNRAIRGIGRNGFAGVYAETDGIARGAIEAMEAAGIDPASRPVTGRDATPKGRRQILAGRQYMTTYAPPGPKARRAAEVAVTLAEGGELSRGEATGEFENGRFRVPAILLRPLAVTRANVDRIGAR